jgi:uncharacterized protein YndB with AHSA1/START domain
MGREFEERNEAELPATPEEVWEAIATGPGIDSWFMGRTETGPGVGGAVQTDFGGLIPQCAVTVWDPLNRLAYGTGEAPDGRFIAYEFLIQGREGGSTVLRTVTSGFLPGEDWEAEYDAMTKGGELFFRTLVEYLTHFRGSAATPVTAFGPPVTDWEGAWTVVHGALGLPGDPAAGDRVRLGVQGLAPIDGVVYFVNPHTLGVRTSDALYRFLRGFHGPMIASHHLFAAGVDPRQAEQAWQTWLARSFA